MTDAPFEKAADSNGNPRAVSVRIKAASASKVGGQNAHDLRRGAQPAYVDATRSHVNRVLIAPLTAPQLRQIVTERRAIRTTQRALKSNAAIGTVGIITFGHLAQTFFNELSADRQDEALKAVASALAARLKTTVTGLVLHLDEAAPHAHFQLPAYDLDGNPLSQTTSPSALADLQTIVSDTMKSFDPRFERGFKKQDRIAAGATPEEVNNKTVAELHQTQAADLEKARATLASLQEKIEKNIRLISQAEAKIEAGKGDLSRLTTNIETYTRRLQTAQTGAEKAEARLSDLNAQITTSTSRASESSQAAQIAENRLATLNSEITTSTATAATATKAATAAQAQLDDLAARNRQLEADVKAQAARRQEADEELARISANISAANKKKEQADKKAADAEKAKKESEDRQAAAEKKEEEQAERQRKKFQQLEDDEKALHRAQELIEQAMEIAQINIELLADPAANYDPESKNLPSVSFAAKKMGHHPTRLDRLEFATGFEPESFGSRLARSPQVVAFVKRMFDQIRQIVSHAIFEKERVSKEVASITQTARHQADQIKESATPAALKSLQTENSNLKAELETRQSFFQFMTSMLKVELGESYAPLAEKVNAAWAEKNKPAPAPAAPAPSAPPSRPSGPSGP